MRAPAQTTCSCDQSELERVHRTWWMRLTSSKRLYECRGCGVRLFIPKQAVERIPRRLTRPADDAAA